MEQSKNFKRFLVIVVLAFGTTAMYSLPYMKSSFYDPMQQALQLTHTQIGNLLSLYGMVGMVSYFVGGWFADKFSVKKLISFSLISLGALGFYFSTFPSYNMILLIFVLWGVTTILTFFAESIKVVRMQELVYYISYIRNRNWDIILGHSRTSNSFYETSTNRWSNRSRK